MSSQSVPAAALQTRQLTNSRNLFLTVLGSESWRWGPSSVRWHEAVLSAVDSSWVLTQWKEAGSSGVCIRPLMSLVTHSPPQAPPGNTTLSNIRASIVSVGGTQPDHPLSSLTEGPLPGVTGSVGFAVTKWSHELFHDAAHPEGVHFLPTHYILGQSYLVSCLSSVFLS